MTAIALLFVALRSQQPTAINQRRSRDTIERPIPPPIENQLANAPVPQKAGLPTKANPAIAPLLADPDNTNVSNDNAPTPAEKIGAQSRELASSPQLNGKTELAADVSPQRNRRATKPVNGKSDAAAERTDEVTVARARTWTSASGSFNVEGELVEAQADGTLLLKRPDGSQLKVKLAQLSNADQEYVRQHSAIPLKDDIGDRLQAARAERTKALGSENTALRMALDEAIKKTAATGKLDEVKAMMAEKKAYESAGTLPANEAMKVAVEKYLAGRRTASTKLVQAYRGAISDYTKKLEVEKATVVQKEMDAFVADEKKSLGIRQDETAKAPDGPATVGIKLKLIPAGEFLMGSRDAKGNRAKNEQPRHRVRITRPFYMGVYEVTQAEYEQVMGNNPSYFSPSGGGKEKVAGIDTSPFPVDQVSWNDAQEFCRRLSQREGKTYRLPTEAEWEYACRAGTKTAFHYGDSLAKDQANIEAHDKGPTRIGSYRPNAFGLYDMHGNVWEWCSDWYEPNYYAKSPAANPKGPDSGTHRVVRGGSWDGSADGCRSSTRVANEPTHHGISTGFRVVREK